MAYANSGFNNNGSGLSNPNGYSFSGISAAPLDKPLTGYQQTRPLAGQPAVTSSYQIPAALPSSAVQHPTVPAGLQPATHTVTTNPDGTSTTKQTFDTSGASSGDTKPGLIDPNASAYGGGTPGTNANNGSNFSQNVNNINQAAQTNPGGQGAANASALYGILGNNAGLIPFSGNQQSLNQSFADLTRPQSTGNLAGEEGLFNTQDAIFQNAANTSAGQALQNKQSNIGAAENVAGVTAPQQTSITSGIYQPGSNTFGQFAGAAGGANGAGQVGLINSQINAGENAGTAAQAIGKAIPIANNLDNLIQTNGINPTNLTFANGAIQSLEANAGSPAQQAAITEFNGQINDLAQTLAQTLGNPGGATTDFKTSLGQSIVNGLQNGQSIQQSIQYFIQQAAQGALGAFSASQNPLGTLNGASQNSSLYHF